MFDAKIQLFNKGSAKLVRIVLELLDPIVSYRFSRYHPIHYSRNLVSVDLIEFQQFEHIFLTVRVNLYILKRLIFKLRMVIKWFFVPYVIILKQEPKKYLRLNYLICSKNISRKFSSFNTFKQSQFQNDFEQQTKFFVLNVIFLQGLQILIKT